MRQMKYLLILIFLTGCLTCCTSNNQTISLAVCGSYGSPGMMCYDLKGDEFSCEVMEEDAYGRILFAYSCYNQITEADATVFMICQKIDSSYVYYYEDVCYIYQSENQDLLVELKNRNDWEKPLRLDQMTRRPISVSFDLVLQIDAEMDIKTVIKRFCQAMDIIEEQIEDRTIIDSNLEGQGLYLFIVEENEGLNKYFVLGSSNQQIRYALLRNVENYASELALFKMQNGWKYNE